MRGARLSLFVAFGAAVVLTSSCRAITDLGRFEVVDTGGGSPSGSGGSTASSSSVGGAAASSSSSGGSTTTSGVGGSGGAGGAGPMPIACAVNATCPSEGCVDGFCAEPIGIAAGAGHACVLLQRGTIHCWGANAQGEVGDGTQMARLNPTPVNNVASAIGISAGRRSGAVSTHTCAVLDSGNVQCWGSNNTLQAGNMLGGTTLEPTTVAGLADVKQVSAGAAHTCAVTNMGDVYCWGDNNMDQLGVVGAGTHTPQLVLSDVDAIVAGDHFTCAQMGTGALKCWGLNAQLQLGSAGASTTPKDVPTVAGATDIAAGRDFACAMAGPDTGWCWGANNDGQLGLETTSGTEPVTVVANLTNVRRVRAGSQLAAAGTGGHTCTLLLDETIACWGQNSNGQIGNATGGPAIDQLPPATVLGLASVVEIALGTGTTCARQTTGKLWCWGHNADGRLGTGVSGAFQNTPQEVVWPDP